MMYSTTILITGVCGFIASNLVIYLVTKYPDIMFIGIDKISYCSSTNNIKTIRDKDNFIFMVLDLLNLEKINDLFELYTINKVFHLAAFTHVDNSFYNSIEFTKNNVLGTHNLLEVARRWDVSKFIHMSTDEVYGSNTDISYEYSALDPTNPYSATKSCAEHLVKSYFYSYQLPIIIIRCNNIYGRQQFPEKVIPRFILRLLNNQKCQIQGRGQHLRSFLYIDDFNEAFDLIDAKGLSGNIYNIGSTQEYDVNSIAHKIIKLIYPDDDVEKWIEYTDDRNFNDRRYHISTDKIYQLGWKEHTDIDTGIQLTLQWYQSNLNHWTQPQIEYALKIK